MENAACDIGYANFWCVAVNPPDDDRFPVLLTANVDPRELLNPQDADARLTLICPKKAWGGVCPIFCEKGAVVVFRSGVSQALKRPRLMFRIHRGACAADLASSAKSGTDVAARKGEPAS